VILLATKAAPSNNAADIAATRYAVAVSMVLDRLDDNRLALGIALKNERVLVAKALLTEMYDIERALQARIDLLGQSDWGGRLRHLMDATAALVDAEVSRFPDEVGHILGSCRSRGHQSLIGRLINLVWGARDAVSGELPLAGS